ncbi:recombination-associated protein RdgC, partial [Klebsiella pneumoniae]|uniref:recombination-associated protein RdgC n=1 Tax=Klebsiella pneumoniae TaxID=573 RepID=UPI001E46C8BF
KEYCHHVNGLMVFSIKKQEKLLPSSVVNEELAPKIDAMEQEKGRPLSRKEKQTLKEELVQTLLPRAFSKSTVTTAYYDRSTSMLIVDTASASAAEEFLALLRKAFGSLPAMPLLDNHQLNQQMHFWLQGKELPAGITLG